jgi:hypothetical protein
VGGELFQPDIIVMVQAGFIVVDENRGGDVHGVDECEAILDAALVDSSLHVAGDVDEGASGGHFEPEFFAVAFHW